MRPLILASLIVPALVLQAAEPAPGPLTSDQRRDVVESLRSALAARYVFPDVAARVGKALADKLAKGGYDGAATPQALAEALQRDLRALGEDGHFRVRFDPSFKPRAESEDRPPTPAEVEDLRVQTARRAFGLARVEILQGNIGYLDVRGFGPAEFVAPAFAGALQVLSGTEALILDLRQNGGGDPESVATLASHLFPVGDARHLNSIYSRLKDSTRQFWTLPNVGPRYTRPVYVLTSAFTFSGGEECAYDLQAQKRATIVGEITGGGANPGSVTALAQGFLAFIPTGRAINPVTGTNWEHVGVKPDLPAPAADALRTAHLAALRAILEKEKDTDYRKRLEAWIARVEKGEAEPPRFTR